MLAPSLPFLWSHLTKSLRTTPAMSCALPCFCLTQPNTWESSSTINSFQLVHLHTYMYLLLPMLEEVEKSQGSGQLTPKSVHTSLFGVSLKSSLGHLNGVLRPFNYIGMLSEWLQRPLSQNGLCLQRQWREWPICRKLHGLRVIFVFFELVK